MKKPFYRWFDRKPRPAELLAEGLVPSDQFLFHYDALCASLWKWVLIDFRHVTRTREGWLYTERVIKSHRTRQEAREAARGYRCLS